MASPGSRSTSHEQPVVDFRAMANKAMGALVIEKLKADMMLADEQIKVHWSMIQAEFAVFDQKKNALFIALQESEGEARADEILDFQIKIMQPEKFWDIYSDVMAKKGKIDAQMAAMEPQAWIAMMHKMRANINHDLNAHANLTGHTRSPTPAATACSMTVGEPLGYEEEEEDARRTMWEHVLASHVVPADTKQPDLPSVVPFLRLAPRRKPQPRSNRPFVVRTENWSALFLFCGGEVAGSPCENCRSGRGPWRKCVVLPAGTSGGMGKVAGMGCANCLYNGHRSRCSLGLPTKSTVDNQESECPTPATTPTAKRPFPSGDPGPSTAKRARTTPDTVGHSSPTNPTNQANPTSPSPTSSTGVLKVPNKPVDSWEVEGNEYIFQYPPFGDGWFVLRCDMGPDAISGVGGPGKGGFVSHPLRDNNALRHFNDDKTCVGHDPHRTYTEAECMMLYAHQVVGDDVNEVWVSEANSVLEGVAGKAGRDKGKGPEIGPANRPRGGPARSRRINI